MEPIAGLVVSHRFRVRYAETDQMGVVYHANYWPWMELGRTEYMRALGYPYRRFEEEGLYFVIVEMDAKLRRPARYDDWCEVRTVMERVRPSSITFQYEVHKLSDPPGEEVPATMMHGPNSVWAPGELLTTGRTRLACIDSTTREVQPIPDSFATLLRACKTEPAG